MSGFNLDFSGLFGGGGFTLDSSKFNFDAYKAPEPKKEAVVDPIDVVSTNTPTPDVEVLEGAGTVTVTKPDPVQQAINDLQGKDLTQSLNVNPVASAPTTDPIEQATQSVQPAAIPSLSNLGGISGFDVTQSSVDKSLSDAEKQQQVLNPLISDIDNFGLDNFSVQANDGFITKDQFGEIKDLMGSDEFANILNKYNSGMKDAFGDEYDGSFQGYDDKRSVLDSLGITNSFKVYTDELGSFDFMEYNSESGQFEKIEDKSKEVNKTNQIIKGVAESLPIMAATAGVGSALAGSSAIAGIAGGNTAVANAIGSGLASGLTTAATGGNTEDILLNTALGGLGGYTEGVAEAQELAQANVDNLSAIANSGVAGESLIAQSQLANATATLKEINATAEVVNTINNTVDLVQAVDQKDALGIVNSALALGGMSSSQTLASDKIKETFEEGSFIVDNADVIASVGVEAVATIAEGGDAEEVLQESANTLVKEVVLTDMNVKTAVQDTIGGNEFVDSNIDAITQAVKAGGFALTDGKNREETIRDAFNAYRENDGQLTPELEDSESPDFFENVEKWYHENIEDPLEDWWQEIEPVREMFEEAGQVVVDTVDEYVVQPVTKVVESIIEGADEAVRALPTTKEDWQALEDTVKEGASDAAEVVRDTGRAIEEGYGVAEDFVKEEVAPAINATGRAIREAIPDVNLPDVDVDLPDVDVNMPDVDLDIPLSVSADPEITKERRGFYYDDSDLVRNPFLNNQQQRIRSLTDMIAFEKEQKDRRAKILADEEKRKLRYKSVYGVNPNIKVEYTG